MGQGGVGEVLPSKGLRMDGEGAESRQEVLWVPRP